MSSFWLRKLIDFYLPMLAAGIRVTKITDDFRHAEVRMVLRFYNRNARAQYLLRAQEKAEMGRA